MTSTHAYTPATRSHLHHPCPWHGGSEFGPGIRRPWQSDAERRAWLNRMYEACRASRLTDLHAAVLRRLAHYVGPDGRCDPSHATLAAEVGRGISSVQEALKRGRELGLVFWTRRLDRVPWPEGGRGATRTVQRSNQYVLLIPSAPVAPAEPRKARPPRPVKATNTDGGIQAPLPLSYQLSQLPELTDAEKRRIETIRADRTARLHQEWQARRAERWRPKG